MEKETVVGATVNRELAYLKRLYNLAIKWGQAKKNPVNDIDFFKEPPGRNRFLNVEESRSLSDAACDYLKPVVFTGLNTGVRLNEILTLAWRQVHSDTTIEPYIQVDGNITINNKHRWVPLNDNMIALFEGLRDNHPIYVFTGRRGRTN